jgi:hypothetical protein
VPQDFDETERVFGGLRPNVLMHTDVLLTFPQVKTYILSGWRDLNPRPLAPKASALPSCATPRRRREVYL